MLTAEECHAKRNELNAMARKAEEAGDEALGSRCRLMAANMLLIADPKTRERGLALYEKNKDRLERDMPEVMKARAAIRSVG